MAKKKEEDVQKISEEIDQILSNPEDAERRLNIAAESYLRRHRRLVR